MPVWHASIAVQVPDGVVPWARCGLKARAAVRQTVIGLLAGVGVGDTRRDRSEFVLHARRRLKPAELELLTPAWCAIPAIDIAGGDLSW